jgi:hypothetical protein
MDVLISVTRCIKFSRKTFLHITITFMIFLTLTISSYRYWDIFVQKTFSLFLAKLLDNKYFKKLAKPELSKLFQISSSYLKIYHWKRQKICNQNWKICSFSKILYHIYWKPDSLFLLKIGTTCTGISRIYRIFVMTNIEICVSQLNLRMCFVVTD